MEIEFYNTSLFSDSSLKSYWRFEGNSNDSKGSNNGTDTTVTYSSSYGKFGQGALFNGTSSKVSIGTASTTNITGDLTVGAWIKPTDFGGGNLGRIFDRGSNGNGGYILLLNNSTATAALRFVAYNFITPTGINSANSAISTGTWNHVVAVRSSSVVTLYVNGVVTGTPANLGTITSNTDTAYIGDVGDGSRIFNGSIDDLFIMDRALSSTEVSKLYSGNWGAGSLFFAQL